MKCALLTLMGACLAVALACVPDRSTQPVAPPNAVLDGGASTCTEWGTWWDGNPGTEVEEEIFGDIRGNVTGVWEVRLVPKDPGSTANQPAYWAGFVPGNFGPTCKSGGSGHLNTGAEWGWYGLGFNDQCAVSGTLTENHPERHRWENAPWEDSVYEGHCVKAGRFDLNITHDESLVLSRPIDFLRYGTAALDTLGTIVGYIEEPDLFAAPGFGSRDVIVHYDNQASAAPATPVIEITAVQNRTAPTWNPIAPQSGAYRAPTNFWLRFSAAKSVPAPGQELRQLLVRYFWRWGVDVTDRTNFVNADDQGANIRVHQLPIGTSVVRAHVVQPFEDPAVVTDQTSTAYGATVDLPFEVYGALTAGITMQAPQPFTVGQSVPFIAGGDNGAGGNSYRWQFGTGEGTLEWSGANDSVSYAFQIAGTKTVTLQKRDLYGYEVTATASVQVVNPPPPLSVSIRGFYSNQNGAIRYEELCTWRADATGGAGNYTYTWTRDGQVVGTSRFLDLNVGTGNFSLQVVVQSAGESTQSTKSIVVTSSGQFCF